MAPSGPEIVNIAKTVPSPITSSSYMGQADGRWDSPGRNQIIAAPQARAIVFIDESGLSERPCRARTSAPRGHTPVLQYSFSWKQLSVIAGISYWRFYFRLFPGAIRTPQVLEFLKALQATIGRKLLIVWDRLQAHRSKLVRQHVEAQRGAIALEYLPAYAPELNPVECIWGYLKHHAMPNYCACFRLRRSQASGPTQPALHAAPLDPGARSGSRRSCSEAVKYLRKTQ